MNEDFDRERMVCERAELLVAVKPNEPICPDYCDICTECLLHCKNRASEDVPSSASKTTPSTVAMQMKGKKGVVELNISRSSSWKTKERADDTDSFTKCMHERSCKENAPGFRTEKDVRLSVCGTRYVYNSGSFEDLKVKRQAPSALGLVHIDRPRYAVNEEPPTKSEVLQREETRRDEQADFCPGRSTIDQVFNVKRVIEIWPRFAIDDIMRRVVDQCPACIVLAPSGCPLADLGYADNVVTFVPITDKTRR
ncbi:hypothetical protein RB195_021707 [Necator americanus]|uniref:Uncharacterized protein n=1 Tax=Necator americanus TaxID=51031 RepID=A0ABR1EEY0_NECAM